MDLWNKVSGILLMEMTAADPERIINLLSVQNIDIWDVERCSQLVIRFRIRRKSLNKVRNLAEKLGAELTVTASQGLFFQLLLWRKRPLILGCLLLLSILTGLLPERILFVDVMGNESVPTRLILEAAAERGLCFGADRRALRSEEIKNELLGAIDSLEWIGVNTYGCRAVISVREREQEPLQEGEVYGNLVAATDGIIENIIMNRGDLLCRTGQAVSRGDVLVSGYKDLGICTRAISPEAEIYALTVRPVSCVLPARIQSRTDEIRQEMRISLIFGKKRINLYSDSGILPPGCGKMTYSLPLKLPGGDVLPVRLVICRIVWYNTQNTVRSETNAEQILNEASRRSVLENTVAGQILTGQTQLVRESDSYRLIGKLQCREMIARHQSGVILEGDTKDDSQNSQRGAG